MNALKKAMLLMLCALVLPGIFPAALRASAATTATEQLTLSGAAFKDASVMKTTEKADKSFTLELADNIYEHGPSWTVSVDVGKVPYFIIQAELDMINRSDIQIKIDGKPVAMMSKSGWMVLELKDYAVNGQFNGSIQVFMRDYYFSKDTGGRGKRSVNTVQGLWLSQTKDLNGKVDQSKLNKIVPRQTISGKTVLKYDSGITPFNVLTEKVDEYGFDMWIDPDQEIEYYKHTGTIHWDVTVNVDNIPYLCVDMAELETAFCLIIFVQDENGTYVDNIPFPYILAGSSGLQVYNLKETLAGRGNGGFTGKQDLRVAVLVDDGMTAGGQVNYIKQVYFDTQKPVETEPPATETTQMEESTVVTQTETQASGGAEDTGKPAESTGSEATGALGKSSGAWLTALIVAAIVVVLAGAGAAFYLLIIRKKKHETMNGGTELADDISNPTDESDK